VDIGKYLNKLVEAKDLETAEARALLDAVFDGSVPVSQIAAFLTITRIKSMTPAELAGFAGSLRSHAVCVDTGIDNLIDTCGTGGAAFKTFNISTASAIIAAGAGAFVAKHGNRAITSSCGSADVLAALGVNIDPGPEVVAECIRQAHIGFMFAPRFHPAMKYVQPIRRELPFRTVFNILGPLANPASAVFQVMGVADPSLMKPIAETLILLGVKRAMVVHSDGLDELSTIAATKILHIEDGGITESVLDGTGLGLAAATLDDLKGSDARTNARIIREILSGKETGPKRDIVLLNAAAALVTAGIAEGFASGIELARKAIDKGSAQQALERFIGISNSSNT
jgi:anthranilate phosphoribosyltransferase